MNATCVFNNKTFLDVDETGCWILQIVAFLYYYDFGYICIGPLALIIVISIFGRLKGHYRWFILNQAIWDLLSSSIYSCDSVLKIWVKPVPRCFFYFETYSTLFISRVITCNSYSALLLLSISRFMALYYPHAYANLIKGRKIVYTIISFNLLSIFFDIHPLFLYLQVLRSSALVNECVIQQNLTLSMCGKSLDIKTDFLYTLYYNLNKAFMLLQYFKPILFLFLSIIATIMIVSKMAKQIHFQMKQNRKDFSNTARIAVVIGLQVIINCFAVVPEAFNFFIPRCIEIFQLKIIISRFYVPGKNYDGYWDLRLPLWLAGGYGLSSDTCRSTIIQLRVVIEAFIVLVIMTGYREAIMDFIKYIYNTTLSSKKRLKNFKLNKSKVSNPSLF